MTIASTVRAGLASAFSSISANVYSYVPENVNPPAIVIVPDSPYMEPNLINDATIKVKLNFTISCAVAYLSNPASLDNLEALTLDVLAAMPTNYVVGNVERPTVTQVGASTLLVSDIHISTYYKKGD